MLGSKLLAVCAKEGLLELAAEPFLLDGNAVGLAAISLSCLVCNSWRILAGSSVKSLGSSSSENVSAPVASRIECVSGNPSGPFVSSFLFQAP